MFRNKINSKNARAIYFVSSGDKFTRIDKYAPKPTKAKALLNKRDNHNPIPAIVPKNGPKARSIYT